MNFQTFKGQFYQNLPSINNADCLNNLAIQKATKNYENLQRELSIYQAAAALPLGNLDNCLEPHNI